MHIEDVMLCYLLLMQCYARQQYNCRCSEERDRSTND